MKKDIKDLIRSEKKLIILDRDNKGDVISYWKKTRNPLRAPFNFLVIQTMKICPSMHLTRWVFRNILGMKVGKNTGFAVSEIDPLFPELISIGDNSALGGWTKILCHGFTQKRAKIGKVIIGKNVLIGADSLIGPGVTIGDNSVVAMKSLVIEDIPANELWGGNPAKKIKRLTKLI